jgi:HEAT repeat protein
VRLKALDGLKQFAEDPDTRSALTQVLLKDENPGVRTQVIDLLVQKNSDQRHADAMVGVLQELMEKEDNGYIRMRCQKVLQEMNASAEMY